MDWKKILVCSAALILAVTAGCVFILFPGRKEDMKGKEETPYAASQNVEGTGDDPDIDETTVYHGPGDPGDDGEEFEDPLDTVFIPKRPVSRRSLTELALEYNWNIPYSEGKTYFYQGFPIYNEGIDNRGLPKERQTGLGSYGYVLWLYKNVFGTLDREWLDVNKFYSSGREVGVHELEVGDIGMMSPAGSTPNHFGVCIGFSGEHPVFSHCLNSPTEKYPLGCTRLSFLKGENDDYIQGSAPVEFTVFFRPDAEWGEEAP